MSISQKKVAGGFVAGLVLGAAVLTAVGQNVTAPKGTTARKATGTKATTKNTSRGYTLPRYAVQYDSAQRLLMITDNATSQLYLYDTGKAGGASQLRGRIDLRYTGANVLRSIAPRTRGPAAKGAKTEGKAKGAAKGKPASKKPSPKKKS